MKPASLTVPARVEFVRPASQFVLQTARHLGASAAADLGFGVVRAREKHREQRPRDERQDDRDDEPPHAAAQHRFYARVQFR